MTLTHRRVLGALALGLACLSAACDGGFTDEEATARCNQERDARGGASCMTDEVYQQCIDAYVECGEDVAIGESCPMQFSCEAD